MANRLDMKLLIKHLANGTLNQNICVSCLMPLKDSYENIFTKVCKADKEYSVADILSEVCHIEFTEKDHYNVCIECFKAASAAYKFYLQVKRSQEILELYTEELINNFKNIQVTDDKAVNSFCILPTISPQMPFYDYDLSGIGLGDKMLVDEDLSDNVDVNINSIKTKQALISGEKDEDIVLLVKDADETSFYKMKDGQFVLTNKHKKESVEVEISNVSECTNVKNGEQKIRKKRIPMTYKSCTRCPVKYRFLAKLMKHVKMCHQIKLYVCKACNLITEDELEYHNHLKMHTNIHQCAICNMVFKNRNTIISHLKRHEQMQNMNCLSSNAYVCEMCGTILESEEKLKLHYVSKHDKMYTCYYCGRMYRGEISLKMHIKKHEMHVAKNSKINEGHSTTISEDGEQSKEARERRRYMCATCGRHFVDERALMWHQRLHNNEKPFKCDVCGRAFVSANRRNQHATCAHTAPTRRCPLCPALFHLPSMVNTHIKKVHLKVPKRRSRVSKYLNAYWRTEPVPIQELSIPVQNEILELQTANEDDTDWKHAWRALKVESDNL